MSSQGLRSGDHCELSRVGRQIGTQHTILTRSRNCIDFCEHVLSRSSMSLQGKAPAGMEFVDVEEEYVVDEHGFGSWQPVTDSAPPAEAKPARRKAKKAKMATSQEAPAPELEEGPEADMEEI